MAGDGGDDVPGSQGPGQASLENLVLAVTSWWVGKFTRMEALDLMTRHYLPADLYVANQNLAQACGLTSPGIHRNSINRSAGESYAIDLYNNLYQLSQEKKLPRLLVCSDDLGKVPFGALTVSDERSASARLETLENSICKITTAVEKMAATLASPQDPSVLQPMSSTFHAPKNQPLVQSVPGQAPQLVISPAPTQQVPLDWAHVAAGPSGQHSLGDNVTASGSSVAILPGRKDPGNGISRLQNQNGKFRARSPSPSVKRKAPGEDDEGFKPQGRPRKTAGGSSKVIV